MHNRWLGSVLMKCLSGQVQSRITLYIRIALIVYERRVMKKSLMKSGCWYMTRTHLAWVPFDLLSFSYSRWTFRGRLSKWIIFSPLNVSLSFQPALTSAFFYVQTGNWLNTIEPVGVGVLPITVTSVKGTSPKGLFLSSGWGRVNSLLEGGRGVEV